LVASNANPRRPKLTPTTRLLKRELTTFNKIANDFPHLQIGDTPLLTTFCIISGRLQSGKVTSASDLDKLARSCTQLARALRITARSRTDPKTLSRAVRNKYAWETSAEEEEEEPDEAG
jgi:hypothetical protein